MVPALPCPCPPFCRAPANGDAALDVKHRPFVVNILTALYAFVLDAAGKGGAPSPAGEGSARGGRRASRARVPATELIWGRGAGGDPIAVLSSSEDEGSSGDEEGPGGARGAGSRSKDKVKLVSCPGLTIGTEFPVGSVVEVAGKQYVRVESQQEGVSLVPEGLTSGEAHLATAKWAASSAPAAGGDVLVFRLHVPRWVAMSRGVLAWLAYRFAMGQVPVPANDQGSLLLQGLLPTDLPAWLGKSNLTLDGIHTEIRRLDHAYARIFTMSDPVTNEFHSQLPTLMEAAGPGGAHLSASSWLARWGVFASAYNKQLVASLRRQAFEVRGELNLEEVRDLRTFRAAQLPSMYLTWAVSEVGAGSVPPPGGRGPVGGGSDRPGDYGPGGAKDPRRGFGGGGGPHSTTKRSRDAGGGADGTGEPKPSKQRRGASTDGADGSAKERACFAMLRSGTCAKGASCTFSHDALVLQRELALISANVAATKPKEGSRGTA